MIAQPIFVLNYPYFKCHDKETHIENLIEYLSDWTNYTFFPIHISLFGESQMFVCFIHYR